MNSILILCQLSYSLLFFFLSRIGFAYTRHLKHVFFEKVHVIAEQKRDAHTGAEPIHSSNPFPNHFPSILHCRINETM